jgi:hypothetical protein
MDEAQLCRQMPYMQEALLMQHLVTNFHFVSMKSMADSAVVIATVMGLDLEGNSGNATPKEFQAMGGPGLANADDRVELLCLDVFKASASHFGQ